MFLSLFSFLFFYFFFLLLACFKCRDTKSKGAQLSSLHHDSSEFLFLLFSVLLGPIRTQTLVDISCLPRITSKVLFFCRVGLRRAVEGWGGVRKWATVTLSLARTSSNLERGEKMLHHPCGVFNGKSERHRSALIRLAVCLHSRATLERVPGFLFQIRISTTSASALRHFIRLAGAAACWELSVMK